MIRTNTNEVTLSDNKSVNYIKYPMDIKEYGYSPLITPYVILAPNNVGIFPITIFEGVIRQAQHLGKYYDTP